VIGSRSKDCGWLALQRFHYRITRSKNTASQRVRRPDGTCIETTARDAPGIKPRFGGVFLAAPQTAATCWLPNAFVVMSRASKKGGTPMRARSVPIRAVMPARLLELLR
jgi:hypothetical protein